MLNVLFTTGSLLQNNKAGSAFLLEWFSVGLAEAFCSLVGQIGTAPMACLAIDINVVSISF